MNINLAKRTIDQTNRP